MVEGRKVRHGRGLFISGGADGNVYDGEWANDKMHGRGTFRYASNAKYEARARPLASARRLAYVPEWSVAPQGDFEDNLYAGHGVYTFPDGATYEGPFVDAQMHGVGTFTDAQARSCCCRCCCAGAAVFWRRCRGGA